MSAETPPQVTYLVAAFSDGAWFLGDGGWSAEFATPEEAHDYLVEQPADGTVRGVLALTLVEVRGLS